MVSTAWSCSMRSASEMACTFIFRRFLACRFQQVAEEWRDWDDLLGIPQGARGFRFDQNAARADCTHHPHSMADIARRPDGPFGRGDPGAMLRADDHHTSRCIKQLAAAMLMPIELECRGVLVADSDDGAVDMLNQRWIGPRHLNVPL